ncbi:hypothetical protein BDV28DRAFT_141098 [Aspergillus coremiiformis]|uniref:F-box domain-containing protein n=1 Tax=Aspergillus coremiiformis TaxID=138285 RepID=A0A5N6YVK1_9EURO|nr:hypothetical protein BDV28DRAFT_141098 [Aspergillus coremiiformis]
MAMANRKFPSLPLSLLPLVVLHEIIGYLDHSTLRSLARASDRLESVFAPEIFKSVSLEFSEQDFTFLYMLAGSGLAKYVKTLQYNASTLLHPDLSDAEKFYEVLFTPEDYVNSQSQGLWSTNPYCTHYYDIQPFLLEQLAKQSKVVYSQADSLTLDYALPKLSNLEKFIFRFEPHVAFHEHPACFWDMQGTFRRHWTSTFQPMCAREPRMASIRSLELFLGAATMEPMDLDLIRPLLQNVEELHLHEFRTFEFIADHIKIRSLKALRLTTVTGLRLGALEAFCRRHRESLRGLHLADIQGHFNPMILEDLQDFRRIGQACPFEEVTVSVHNYLHGATEQPEIVEALLLGGVKDVDPIKTGFIYS